MFGMIHRSARDMVHEQFGAAAWDQVLETAGLDEAVLVSAQNYPDETTLRLVEAAARTAGLTLDETLEAFGRHWVRAADRGPYSGTLRMLGGSLLESLTNLDSMHASIQIAMPEARLPQFRVIAHGPAEIRVAYHSHRQGLEAFVRGLLEGLLARFSTLGTVAQAGRDQGAPVFVIALAG